MPKDPNKTDWPKPFIRESARKDMWLTLELNPRQRELIRRMQVWGELAECKGSPLFTLDIWGLPKECRVDVEEACKKLCSICPVIDECYAHAMQYPEVGGYWAGLSQEERKALRKRRQHDRDRRPVSERELHGVRG